MNKQARVVLWVFGLFFIASVLSITYLVLADHVITTGDGGTSESIDEDVSSLINISVNNSDSGQDANITEVNITLWGNFEFTHDTNESDVPEVEFTNTSEVLSWLNNTDYVINGSEIKYFWFNATATTPGTYNITIATTNVSGTFETNISITVNDTTVPAVTINLPQAVNTTQLDVNITLNEAGYCEYSLDDGTNNATLTNNGDVDFNDTNSSIADRIYNITAYCNDTSGNTNFTEISWFQIDATVPSNISIVDPTPSNGTGLSDTKIEVNVTATDATGIDTITIYLQNSTFDIVETNYSTTSSFYINYTGLTEGTYYINASVNDSANNINNTIETRVITLDTTDPSAITLEDPTSVNASYTAGIVIYDVSATDAGGIDTITVYLYDSSHNEVNTSTSSSSPLSGNFSVSEGTYYINATVNDTAGNSNSTINTRKIYVKSYWEFNGTAYDVNSVALNNTQINVTIWSMGNQGPALNTSVYIASDASGLFSVNVPKDANWMYKPVVRHFNASTSAIDYVGQSLPTFPFAEFANKTNLDFYLQEAGTLNITAINTIGDRIAFNYMVKDTKLGFDVESSWSSTVTEVNVYVQRNRNYSVMIFPQSSMPVSLDWSNFSESAYNITSNNISSYHNTTHTVHKQFNTSMSLVIIDGYIQNTSGEDFADWNNFTVVPYLLEPGDMVYTAQGGLPYNMSSWNATPYTDSYNSSSGYYKITLPGPEEGGEFILFATAKTELTNESYGGYINVSTTYGMPSNQTNITMYPLMSTDWGSSTGNITMNIATDWSEINISSAKQTFRLVNTTNDTLTTMTAHIEATVDYSDYGGCKEFTFMTDVSTSSGAGTFSLPLLNATGVKEMNVYTMGGAPRRVDTKSPAQILSNSNIIIESFGFSEADGDTMSESDMNFTIYKSNATCDVPNPPAPCVLTSFVPTMSNLQANMLPIVIGGGKISPRITFSGISVHYVNVDMLASGPPDSDFDNALDDATSSGSAFSAAMKFGSGGPTVYDYILLSVPYTQGSSSQTGLNESASVTASIPIFYDENWNAAWSSSNGSNASALAGNYSHYSTYEEDWQVLMTGATCSNSSGTSALTTSSPCIIQTVDNRIWMRLPHFSGAGTDLSGSRIVASSSEEEDSSSGSGGVTSSIVSGEKTRSKIWSRIADGASSVWPVTDKTMGVKQVNVTMERASINIKLVLKRYDHKPSNVSTAKTTTYKYLQFTPTNLENMSKAVITIRVGKNWLTNNSVARDDISLFRYNEGSDSWEELTTTYKEDDTYYDYYDVELTSFSYFAIASSKVGIVEDTGDTDTGDGDAGDDGDTGDAGDAGTEDEGGSNIGKIILIIVGVIIIGTILGVVAIVLSNKKNKKKFQSAFIKPLKPVKIKPLKKKKK